MPKGATQHSIDYILSLYDNKPPTSWKFLHCKTRNMYSGLASTIFIVSFSAYYRMAVSLSAEDKQKHHKQLKGKMYLTASFTKRKEKESKLAPKELNIRLSDK